MEGFGGDGETVNGHFKPFVGGPTVAIKLETEPYHDSGVVTDQGYYGSGLQYETAVYQTVYNPDYSNSTEVPLATGRGGTAETTCDLCDKVFSSNASMRRHREIHTGVKKFSCDLCGNRYTQQHNLTKHMRLHTGEKPFKCCHCEKEFYIMHHLKNHLALHGKLTYRCETCGKAYKRKYKMEAHIRSAHSGGTAGGSVAQSPTSGMTSDDNSMEEPWTNGIDEDGSEDENQDDEDYYEGMDDGETTYDEHECEVCQAIFINEESLNNHMKLQHSVDQEYRCDKCSNIFLTRAHLVRHRKSHTGEQIFECKECNVSFRWKVSLHIHMRRHNNDTKRYECTLCNKYFLAKESLRRHQNSVHLGVNSYECDECGEKFTQKSDYKNHLLAHDSSDIKTKKPAAAVSSTPKSEPKTMPTCKTCHKTFSSNSSLRKHEYTHMDEKPHKCELCNVSFAQKIQLRLHNKKHNGGKMEPPSQPPYTKKTVSPAKKVEKRNNDFKDGTKSSENSLDSSERSRSPSPAKNSQISASSPTKLRIRLEKVKTEPVPERRNAARKARQMFKAMEEEEEETEEEDEEEDEDDDEEEEEENEENNKRKTRTDGYRYPTCDNCGKRFKKNKALNRHLKFCKQK